MPLAVGVIIEDSRESVHNLPERSESWGLLKPKCSMANRDASGEEGLFDGGVGRDADGAGEEIRAPSSYRSPRPNGAMPDVSRARSHHDRHPP